MKNRSVSLCLLTATLFAAPAFAQGQPTENLPASTVPAKTPRPDRAEMIKRFDQDGDGQLNDAERQTAREAVKQKWAGRKGPGGPGGMGRERLRQRFDRDGDGRLNERERHAARKGVNQMRHRMQHMMMMREMHRMHAFGGRGGPPRLHGHGPAGPGRGPVRQAMLQRFDQDHDGRLNDTERAEARKAGEARRTQAQAHRKEALTRFDADGDGQLGETERQAMREAWQKFITQQPPVTPAAK
jgi:hypothetical protein